MILHITNDYAGSTVYKNLIYNLDNKGVKQIVYTPIKSEKSIGKNKVPLKQNESKIIYRNILNKHTDRVLFPLKINKIFKDIQNQVDFTTINLIHAHTWFSDGAVALKLHKKYKTPYVIAVRGTDLNQFWRLPYLKKTGIEILKNASKIVFITPKYRERFLDIEKIKNSGKSIALKPIVIPNGLDSYWLKNVKKRKTTLNRPINLLYIGVFSTTKNVQRLLKAIDYLNNSGILCTLTLVGGGGNQTKKVMDHIADKMHITFLGKIYNKRALSKLFQQTDIFVMPSLQETFGLVYGEALSQGLPILYSKNEGIDGVFNESIGVAVNPKSVESIADGLKEIIMNYDRFDFKPEHIVKKLDWKIIAKNYIDIYKETKYIKEY